MSRIRLSPTRRLAHFLAAGGRCAGCGWRIQPGQRWDLDHIRPLSEGGSNADCNLQVLCRTCHGVKSSSEHTRTAQARRRKLRHLGAARSSRPLQGGRRTRWKRGLDGTVRPRNKW